MLCGVGALARGRFGALYLFRLSRPVREFTVASVRFGSNSDIFLPISPLMNPPTLCACQEAAFINSAKVAPSYR